MSSPSSATESALPSSSPPSSSAPAPPIAVTRCPDGTVLVSKGDYTLGDPKEGWSPKPFSLSADLCVDVHEVTVASYEACVAAGKCARAERAGCQGGGRFSDGDKPIHCVDFAQAMAFCTFVRMRLPEEREWEVAAQSAQIDPKLDVETKREECLERGPSIGACRVQEARKDKRGLQGMPGNVREWTASEACTGKPECSRFRAVRGGSFRRGLYMHVGPSSREEIGVGVRADDLGFRCVCQRSECGTELPPQ